MTMSIENKTTKGLGLRVDNDSVKMKKYERYFRKDLTHLYLWFELHPLGFTQKKPTLAFIIVDICG